MRTLAAIGLFGAIALAEPAFALTFLPSDLVVSVEGNGVVGGTGSYGDNQAAPLTLFEYTTGGAYVGSEVLPQTASGSNYAVSGEYGSSSEGSIQLSGNQKYLTVMGYGVNAATFNSNPGAYGPSGNTALAQSYATDVPRVVVTISANGTVNSSTALTNVFDQNNPRSVYSPTGTTFYVSGQGNSPDHTGGVFYATLGSHTATAVTGNDTSSKTYSQDTRFVTAYDGTLYVSVDSKEGSGSNRDFIGTLGSSTTPPTGVYNNSKGPTQLPGFGNSGGTGKVVITAATSNGINSAGEEINLSPDDFFFANADTLYVADSGAPKNDSESNDGNGSPVGDGGLQKWVLNTTTGQWSLEYTLGLAQGLPLVANNTANPADTSGTTGLLGLTGKVVGNEVYLYATNYTIGDLDQTYLFEITDLLGAPSPGANEDFVTLATAPADSNFKGVSFAPVPEPAEWALLLTGFGLVGGMVRRGRRARLAEA